MPLRLIASGLLTVGYLVFTQWLMTSAPPSPWNAVGLLTPMLGTAALASWQAGQRWLAGVAGLAILALCVQAAAGHEMPAPRLYLAQHVAVNVALGGWFASTLREGGTALITSLAARLHRQLPPALVDYTRALTRAWTAFFFLTAAASVAVYLLLPFDLWAGFSNLVCPALIGAMFAGERLLRYRLHPDFERVSLADQVRAWREHGAERRSAAGGLP